MDTKDVYYGKPGTVVAMYGKGDPQIYPKGVVTAVVSTQEVATRVFEALSEILDKYGYVTVADYYHFIGIPTKVTANRWGWKSLIDGEIKQATNGFLIYLPPVERVVEEDNIYGR